MESVINSDIKHLLTAAEKTDTCGKMERMPILWKLTWYGLTRCQVFDGYHCLLDEPDPDTLYITPGFYIYIVTTNKGNRYGIPYEYKKDRPEIAALFNKRVVGTQKKIWTDDIDKLEKAINYIFSKKGINKIPENPYWVTYDTYFTSEDKANNACDELNAMHRQNIINEWKTEKAKQLQESIDNCMSSITYYKKELKDRQQKMKTLQNELAKLSA